MSDYFDYDAYVPSTGGGEQNPLKQGEKVSVLILGTEFPTAHRKAVEEKNKSIIAENESLGIDAPLTELSFKEGGMSLSCAILSREGVDVWGDNVVKPTTFRPFISIQSLPPAQTLEKKWSAHCKGLKNIAPDGGLNIGYILPNPFPAKNWDTGVIDEGKEALRVSAWSDVVDWYNNASEELCQEWHYKKLAQRLLLLDAEAEKLVKPQTGLVFEATISRKEGSQFFDIQRFSWNNDLRKWNVHGELYLLNSISNLMEEKAAQIAFIKTQEMLQRSNRSQQPQTQVAEDEVPF